MSFGLDSMRFSLTVRRGREASLRAGHPWVFAGALKSIPANLIPGVIVDLVDESGAFLGRGTATDTSRITVRVLTFQADETVDEAFIVRRVNEAIDRRRRLLDDPATSACRLVFAEADRLPGLIVDRYGDWLAVSILTAGMERYREAILAGLAERLAPRGIVERSDSEDRRRYEGLEPRAGLAWGEAPPDTVTVLEHGQRYAVDLAGGHKTGAYLDQRENRRRVAAWCGGRRVLNAFAYTGGFGLHAAAAGAREVVHVDSSGPALALAEANAAANPGDCRHEFERAQVFDYLREIRDREPFDVIILDPPKFAAGRQQLDRARRGYLDLNTQALRRLRPGGILATFSCSGAVDARLFGEILADAAAAAGCTVLVRELLDQPADHPVLLSFPEGRYLKGLLLEVLDRRR